MQSHNAICYCATRHFLEIVRAKFTSEEDWREELREGKKNKKNQKQVSSTMSSSPFSLFDPVIVQGSGASDLRGLVLYIGDDPRGVESPSFGVRLMGSCAGMGDTNGTEGGVTYFDAGSDNNGVFVGRNQLAPWTGMTRLEELKLKREIRAIKGASRKAKAEPETRTSTNDAEASTSSATPAAEQGGDTTTRKSRLEQLREKRAALEAKGRSVTSSETGAAGKAKAEEDTGKEKEKGEVRRGGPRKDDKSGPVRAAKSGPVKTERAPVKARKAPVKVERGSGVEEGKVEQGGVQNEDREDLQRRLVEAEESLAALKFVAEKQKQSIAEARAARKEAEAELKASKEVQGKHGALEEECRALKEECRTLKEECGALKEESGSVKERALSAEALVEKLTLDAETLNFDKDALEHKLEELTLDCETAMMEVEELKDALADASEGIASAPGESGEGREDGDDSDLRSLNFQNKRLRDALVALRDQSRQEREKLRAAEEASKDAEKLKSEIASLREDKIQASSEISQLKTAVDLSSSHSQMLEDLTDKNLSLEDRVKSLEAANADLEATVELSAEMEEVQAAELKELSLDLQDSQSKIAILERAVEVQKRTEDESKATISKYRELVSSLKSERDSLLSYGSQEKERSSEVLSDSHKAMSRVAIEMEKAARMRKYARNVEKAMIKAEILARQASALKLWLPEEMFESDLNHMENEASVQRCEAACTLGLKAMREAWESSAEKTTGSESDPDVCAGGFSRDCKVGDLLISAGMEAKRTLCEIGLRIQHSENSGETTDCGRYFEEVQSQAMIVIDKLMCEELDDDEGRRHLEQLNESIVNVQQRAAPTRDLESSSQSAWEPEGWPQLKSSAKFLNVAKALHRHLANATFLPPELRLRVTRLSTEAASLDNSLSADAMFGGAEASALLACTKGLAEATTSAIQAKFSEQINFTDALDQAFSALGDCFKSIPVKRLAKTSGSGHFLSPWSKEGYEGCLKYVNSIDGSTNVWTVRRDRVRECLMKGARSLDMYGDLKQSLEDAKESMRDKGKENDLLTKRISQLEDLLSSSEECAGEVQGGTTTDKGGASDRKENTALLEAIEVLQSKVDKYEKELTAVKEGGGRGPRIERQGNRDKISNQAVGGVDAVVTGHEGDSGMALAFSALRPMLRAARMQSAMWRSKATRVTMAKLKPLAGDKSTRGYIMATRNAYYKKLQTEADADYTFELPGFVEGRDVGEELVKASCDLRLTKAGSRVIDITRGEVLTMSNLKELKEARESRKKAEQRLAEALDLSKRSLGAYPAPRGLRGNRDTGEVERPVLAARVKIPAKDKIRKKWTGVFSSRAEIESLLVPTY